MEKKSFILVDRLELESQAQKQFTQVLKTTLLPLSGKRTRKIGIEPK